MIKVDFNEFLRIMSSILIVLLIFQGLDYIFGFGVNNYLFIVFCIAFAFTMGSIYHNIIIERENEIKEKYRVEIFEMLEVIRDNGLSDDSIAKLEDLIFNENNEK